MLGEGIEEGVGGGVVGLTRPAQRAADGGEEHEGGEVESLAQLVQVPGGFGLGRHRPLQALGVERLQDAVVEDPGGVDDRAEGVLGIDRVDQCLELRALGDVAGLDPHRGAELLELGAQVRCAFCLFAAAAGEEQARAPWVSAR